MTELELDQINITKEELEAAALAVSGSEVEVLPLEKVMQALTVGQYLMDRCLAELEKRNELLVVDGQACVPYCSDHAIETFLTRAEQGG